MGLWMFSGFDNTLSQNIGQTSITRGHVNRIPFQAQILRLDSLTKDENGVLWMLPLYSHIRFRNTTEEIRTANIWSDIYYDYEL